MQIVTSCIRFYRPGGLRGANFAASVVQTEANSGVDFDAEVCPTEAPMLAAKCASVSAPWPVTDRIAFGASRSPLTSTPSSAKRESTGVGVALSSQQPMSLADTKKVVDSKTRDTRYLTLEIVHFVVCFGEGWLRPELIVVSISSVSAFTTAGSSEYRLLCSNGSALRS